MASTVWYIGRGERIISSKAWEAYDIEAEDTIWSASNGWSVLTADLTEAQLNVLETMRDQFYLNQDGPRVLPAPNGIRDYQDSAYKYYAEIMDIHDALLLTLNSGTVGGNKWYVGEGAPGVIGEALLGDLYLDIQTGTVYTLN